jgi:hypothetical protein
MRFYPDAVPAAKSTDPNAIDSLICWLAAFHEWAAPRLSGGAVAAVEGSCAAFDLCRVLLR